VFVDFGWEFGWEEGCIGTFHGGKSLTNDIIYNGRKKKCLIGWFSWPLVTPKRESLPPGEGTTMEPSLASNTFVYTKWVWST